MNPAIPEIMGRVGNWINSMQDASMQKRVRDQEADRQSLDRAADLEAIYQDMSWVDEMPPIKKKRLGRRVDPKSREQFAKWVKQYYGWGSQPYLNRLHASIELVPILMSTGMRIGPTGERPLRPLERLREQGYGEHQAEVWREAVTLAGNVPPTEAQVRKAVTEFLDRHKPPVRNVASSPQTDAERRAAKRARLIAQFDELLSEENRTAKEALNEMIRHFNAHQPELREEAAA